MREYVLAINPGSTSTKIALYKGSEEVRLENISHDVNELEKFERITDQFDFRKKMIVNWLEEQGYSTNTLSAVVGRGGLLRPMPSGTYLVTEALKKDLEIGVQGEHASNLGGLIADAIASPEGVPAYIVDPVAVDEFIPEARISGIKEIKRKSLLHALNVRAMAYRYADETGKNIDSLNLIIAHLGGGISVVPLENGKMIDANNANEMGPFSPERTGGLPTGDLARMVFSGEYSDFSSFMKKLRGKGGMSAYLGTNDLRQAEEMIVSGDEKALNVVNAMAYQIGKEIGSMAAVLSGKVDAIILTGGVAYSKRVTNLITEMTEFVAPVKVYAGEDELKSLSEGALRVLAGTEEAKIYEEELSL